jgi:hypothetical protein
MQADAIPSRGQGHHSRIGRLAIAAVVQPPKRRFVPPKRFTPGPIVRQPNLVAPRFRRELDR